ncbi:MAG TPA: FHA domain-containing protein [Candidatus Limnocylindrales bacterium]|nr:FHA domain-containing protein [Candidatus Limnocylindrales bacterium]
MPSIELTPVWIVPAVLGVITLLLLIVWLFTSMTTGSKNEPAQAARPQQPVSQAAAPPMASYAPPPAPAYAPPPQPAYAAPKVEGLGRVAVIAGAAPLGEYPIAMTSFYIGRFVAADQQVMIGLDEKSVSRRHLMVRSTPAKEYFVSDAGSTFGSSIISSDGTMTRMTAGKEERIYNGDIVQLGNAAQVRFILPTEMRSSVTQL